jgi:histidinol-phosphate/aromatic aminotransferase/cobyric acid decarboxylase-like protein
MCHKKLFSDYNRKCFDFGSIYYIQIISENADWLEKVLKENKPLPKLVTVVNPGNPQELLFPGLCLRSSLSSETCVCVGTRI